MFFDQFNFDKTFLRCRPSHPTTSDIINYWFASTNDRKTFLDAELSSDLFRSGLTDRNFVSNSLSIDFCRWKIVDDLISIKSALGPHSGWPEKSFQSNKTEKSMPGKVFASDLHKSDGAGGARAAFIMCFVQALPRAINNEPSTVVRNVDSLLIATFALSLSPPESYDRLTCEVARGAHEGKLSFALELSVAALSGRHSKALFSETWLAIKLTNRSEWD